jgi:hypothetical protein
MAWKPSAMAGTVDPPPPPPSRTPHSDPEKSRTPAHPDRTCSAAGPRMSRGRFPALAGARTASTHIFLRSRRRGSCGARRGGRLPTVTWDLREARLANLPRSSSRSDNTRACARILKDFFLNRRPQPPTKVGIRAKRECGDCDQGHRSAASPHPHAAPCSRRSTSCPALSASSLRLRPPRQRRPVRKSSSSHGSQNTRKRDRAPPLRNKRQNGPLQRLGQRWG